MEEGMEKLLKVTISMREDLHFSKQRKEVNINVVEESKPKNTFSTKLDRGIVEFFNEICEDKKTFAFPIRLEILNISEKEIKLGKKTFSFSSEPDKPHLKVELKTFFGKRDTIFEKSGNVEKLFLIPPKGKEVVESKIYVKKEILTKNPTEGKFLLTFLIDGKCASNDLVIERDMEWVSFRKDFVTFKSFLDEMKPKLARREKIRNLKKVGIKMKKGRFKSVVEEGEGGGRKFIFPIMVTEVWPCELVKKGDADVTLCLCFFDRNEKEFLQKKIKVKKEESEKGVVKSVIVKEEEIIFEHFPVFLQVLDETFFSSRIKLKSIEYFGNLSEIKTKRNMKALLSELKNSNFKINKQKFSVRNLNDFPYEVHLEIFKYLSLDFMVQTLMVVSKEFYKVSKWKIDRHFRTKGREYLLEKSGMNKKMVKFFFRRYKTWTEVFKNMKKWANMSIASNDKLWGEGGTKDSTGGGKVMGGNFWLTKDEYDDAGATIIHHRRWWF